MPGEEGKDRVGALHVVQVEQRAGFELRARLVEVLGFGGIDEQQPEGHNDRRRQQPAALSPA